MTYKEKILSALKQGDMLSKIDILSRFKCLNAGDNIYKLRQDGYDVRKKWAVSKTGKQYAVYYLIADGVRRCF